MKQLAAGLCLLLAGSAPAAAQVVDSAGAAWAAGDTDAAVRLYERRLAADSSDVVALHRVALAKAWSRDFDTSLPLFEKLVAERPSDTDARRDYAKALAWSEHYDRAIAEAERVHRAEPGDTSVLTTLARITSWSRRFDESLAYYGTLIAMRPGDLSLRVERARVLAWSRRYDEAEREFRGVLAADPDNLEAKKGLAQVAGWSGRLSVGERRWRDVLASQPGDVDALVGLAANLRWQGRTVAAMDVLDQAERLAPRQPEVETQREWLNAAAGPTLAPTFLTERDSDGNRGQLYQLAGDWLVSRRVGLRFSADARDFSEDTDLAREASTRSGTVLLSLGLGRGWTLTGGGGARTGDGDTQETMPLWSVGIASPARTAGAVSLTASRTAFDYTALLAQQNVAVEEVTLALHSELARGVRLSARSGVGRFTAAEDNTRWLGEAGVVYRPGLFSVGLNGRAFGFSDNVAEGYWDPTFFGIVEVPLGLSVSREHFFGGVEVAPGYQTVDHPEMQVDHGALRASANAGVQIAPGRRLGVAGVLANSGLQRVSPTSDSNYEYRALRVFLQWSLR